MVQGSFDHFTEFILCYFCVVFKMMMACRLRFLVHSPLPTQVLSSALSLLLPQLSLSCSILMSHHQFLRGVDPCSGRQPWLLSLSES